MRENARGDTAHSVRLIALPFTALVFAVLVGCRPVTHVAPRRACPAQPLEDARLGMRYMPCQLTRLPVLQIDPTMWHYPDMMRDAGMAGRVHAAFVIDAAGRYLPGSMRVLSSSHEIFSAATKYELARAHFSPGRRGNEVVPVEVIHDFIFAIPDGASWRELRGLTQTITLVSKPLDAVPVLEIRLDAEDTMPGPPIDPQLRDSLARAALRTRARELAPDAESPASASSPARLVLCLQGDTSAIDTPGDRALARELTRPHVRVMTMRGCPPTRARMVALPPELEPRYPPDSVPFIEPHRLHVTRVALRRGGGPQIDLFDEYMIGGEEFQCVRTPNAVSISALRCLLIAVVAH